MIYKNIFKLVVKWIRYTYISIYLYTYTYTYIYCELCVIVCYDDVYKYLKINIIGLKN